MPRQHNTPKRKLKQSPLDKAKAWEVVWPQVAQLFESARPYDNASFIYFIGEPDEGPMKIGFSRDPVGRLRNMQTGNSRRLRIEYVLCGGMETEKMLHQFWEPHAIHSAKSKNLPGVAPGTEWFKPEARKRMLPIIKEAVELQIDLLERGNPVASFLELEDAVRDAHRVHGFIPVYYQPTRQLSQGLGYNESRRIRI